MTSAIVTAHRAEKKGSQFLATCIPQRRYYTFGEILRVLHLGDELDKEIPSATRPEKGIIGHIPKEG